MVKRRQYWSTCHFVHGFNYCTKKKSIKILPALVLKRGNDIVRRKRFPIWIISFPPTPDSDDKAASWGRRKTLPLDGNVEMFRKRIVDKSCKFKTHLTFSPDNTVGKGSFAILTMFLQWLTSPIIWQWRIRTGTLWTCFVAQAVLKRKMAILAQSTTKSEVQACTNLQGLVLQVE